MRKTLLLLAASSIALAGCDFVEGVREGAQNAAKEAAEKAEAAEQGFEIPYEKFTLDNGLEVILHVDKSDPIVAFSTVVHVGSNREKRGRTGFAHFFEHMAFNDSENVPRGWNRKAIPEWGGQRNGGTWSDGTIYYEVVPTDAVDKILWIDSDRLGFMINTVTQAALEREKQVVKNEKRQRVDNAAYGFTTEVIKKALYPDDHPYSWTVIGQLEDLQNATLDDLKEFYDQYYGLANVTFAVAGDFDPAEMREKIEYWFGELRSGPDVEMLEPRPVTLEETKSLYWEDNFATLPELRLTFPTVASLNDDEIPLRVLGAVLGGSKGSPLYEVIVDEKKLAPGVSAYNNSQEIAGEFTIRVRANAGTDLDEVKVAIEEALARFEEEGVDPAELQRIKAEQETGLYASVSTVLGKANQLATNNEFAGDPGYTGVEAKKLETLTADDVMAAYNAHIKGKPMVITSFVPQGQAELAVEGATLAEVAVEEVRADVASEEVSQGEEAEYERTPSLVDRSEPAFGELPLFSMPEIYQASIGGARLLGVESDETPVVTFDISIDHGGFFDPDGKRGAAGLMASLMNEGTASKTAAEFEQAAGLLGSSISIDAGSEDTVITVTTLARNFEKTIDLVRELIETPRFLDADFARVQQATLTGIKGRQASPGAIGSLAFQKLLYGEDHPAGPSISGTENSVSALTVADMREAHEALLSSSVRFHVVGDVDASRAEEGLTELAELFSGDADKPALPAPSPEEQDARVFFIDVPGSKQSVILAGKLIVPTFDPAHTKIDFTNEKLGGGISGDFAQVLRIEKGYTYGAYSGISNGTLPQRWQMGTSVRANATGPSLEIIREMIDQYGPTFDESDAEITRQKIVKDNTRAYESLGAKLGLLRSISRYGKPLDFLEQEQELLLSMEVADFQEVAAEHLQEDEMIYVIVGDGETQRQPVTDFAGGSIVELPASGE
ncbi:insulinase family protein [Parvularcula sp. ZS-1/3]|uniref:Insulinase family protein n=1 Tax=Parvularcula mediterranea TaxID=2732508 RepID=A0A7Y3RML5_9PROT|nr:insulinase family protein [Parvularcula mediterranea]